MQRKKHVTCREGAPQEGRLYGGMFTSLADLLLGHTGESGAGG